MLHQTFAGAFALALTLFCTPVAAQVINIQGPDGPMQLPGRGQPLKTGTGVLKGRVLSADTGAPVRRAQIRISGPEMLPKSALTDAEGRYEVSALPAGRFTITATKSGYVTVGYGQTRPFEAGKPVELTEGQVVDKIDITMPRGSVIAGRITDEFGEPVADASVSAVRSTWANGRRRLQPTGRSALTNDLGQYRIYGLSPGEYYVSATLRGGMEMIVAEAAAFASFSGPGQPDSPRSGYAPTYYPGTPNGGEAQKIALAVGQEAVNTDFGLVPVRLARVSGTVIGSDGRPLEGVMVSTVPRNANDGGFMMPLGAGRTDKNGQFTLPGVAPGEYTLSARSTQIMTTSQGDNVTVAVRTVVGGPGGQAQAEFGSVPLSVSGDDVSNVMIVTSKGTSASGRVIYEGGSKPTVNTLRISAASPEADGPMAMLGGSSSVTDEGTFEIRGLAGHRIFRVSNIPSGWLLKAVRLNGTDITDTGVDIRPSEPLTGLEVVLTSRQTEVTGTVTNGNDPVTDYTVVVFSEDSEKWAVPMTRHIASARPNQQGRFQVKNLPAGSYYIVALEYIAQGDWYDPEVLERLKAKATRVSIDEGETETVALKLVGG